MSPAADTVEVHIERPFSIAGQPCARFAVWLLAAAALDALQPGRREGGVSRKRAVRQVDSPGALPMALTRAFSAYARAGVAVGWGPHVDAEPRSLPLRGRVRGPFWIRPEAARRLAFVAGGAPADAQALAAFAGAGPGRPAARAGDRSGAAEPLDLAAWYGLIDARQSVEEHLYGGDDEVLAAGSRADPAPALLDIGLGARGVLARQWGLFFAAQQARRRGQVTRARILLAAAVNAQPHEGGARDQSIRQLCRLGLAWCDYQERRFDAVAAALQRLQSEAEGAPDLLRDNPRLACEFHNLRALWRRATLDEQPGAAKAEAALGLLADLQSALVCALETDAFTLLESVASNLGYTLWLVEPHLPPGLADSGHRVEAIRWILLSDWLCQRHGLAGASAWNLISVCRVARGAGRQAARVHKGVLGGVARLSLAQVREAAGHKAALLGSPRQVQRWQDVTGPLAEAAAAASTGLPPLQRCAAWLEHAWCLAQGSTGRDGAQPWVARIEAQLPALAASDRSFFRAEIRALRRVGAAL